MKRFFILASAAIVAFASCAKTQVVYDGEPQEITFKAVNGSMTKADQTGNFSQTIGVFAYLNTDKSEFFKNAPFEQKTVDAYWTGEKYWPLQSNLDFVVYSPWVDGSTYNTTNKVLTFYADNSTFTNITDQKDYLYGAQYYNDEGSGYNKEIVKVYFKHALSKVTLSFTGEKATLKSVSLAKPYLKGRCKVDYSSSAAVTWSDQVQQEKDFVLSSFTDYGLLLTEKEESIMLVPNAASDILITYTITGSEKVLQATIDLTGDWKPGIHYVYNIDVKPEQIQIDPTVTSWDNRIDNDHSL